MNHFNNPTIKQDQADMIYRNSDRFLTAFNRIEKVLKSFLIKKEMGFSRAVKVLSKSNAMIKQYQDDLLEFAELRNAIVHNKTDLMYTIAEPHDSVVERIEVIEMELLEPRKVDPLFIRKVIYFQQTESLSNVLEIVNQHGITKFPVYKGNVFQGLITHKGITKWFSKGIGKRLTTLLDAKLVEVLECEKSDNFRFISRETSVYEAKEIFKEQIGKGNRLEALLITSEGNANGSLVGIVTNWDIMEI